MPQIPERGLSSFVLLHSQLTKLKARQDSILHSEIKVELAVTTQGKGDPDSHSLSSWNPTTPL
jgi:hypothetical protein